MRHNIHALLGRKAIAPLIAKELAAWGDAIGKRVAPATANRTATVLKAALNMAADNDKGLDRHARETGLAAIKDATAARNEARS